MDPKSIEGQLVQILQIWLLIRTRHHTGGAYHELKTVSMADRLCIPPEINRGVIDGSDNQLSLHVGINQRYYASLGLVLGQLTGLEVRI